MARLSRRSWGRMHDEALRVSAWEATKTLMPGLLNILLCPLSVMNNDCELRVELRNNLNLITIKYFRLSHDVVTRDVDCHVSTAYC